MAVVAALGLAACGFGEEGISVSEDDPNYDGAELFADPLLRLPHAERRRHPGHRQPRRADPGPEPRPAHRDATTTLSSRSRTAASPGAIMPQNIVVGEEAEAVARFVAKYAGQDVEEARRAEALRRPATARLAGSTGGERPCWT